MVTERGHLCVIINVRRLGMEMSKLNVKETLVKLKKWIADNPDEIDAYLMDG